MGCWALPHRKVPNGPGRLRLQTHGNRGSWWRKRGAGPGGDQTFGWSTTGPGQRWTQDTFFVETAGGSKDFDWIWFFTWLFHWLRSTHRGKGVACDPTYFGGRFKLPDLRIALRRGFGYGHSTWKMQNTYALENQQSNGNSTMCRCIAFLTENGYFNPTMFMVECVDTSALSPIECIGRSWSRASTKAKGGQPSGGAGYKKVSTCWSWVFKTSCGPIFCGFNVQPGWLLVVRLHHSIETNLEGWSLCRHQGGAWSHKSLGWVSHQLQRLDLSKLHD